MKNLFTSKKIISYILVLFTISFLGGKTAGQYSNLTDGLNTIAVIKGTDKQAFDTLVKDFCKEMNENTQLIIKSTGKLTYSPKDSLFLYMLCSAVKSSNREKKEYLLSKTDNNGNIYSILGNMLPNYYNNTEDFIQKLFDTIIGSYTTIYQAKIYGYLPDEQKTNEEIINTFSAAYFHYRESNVPADKYINICSNEEDYAYPKTCEKMKRYLNGARNMLNSSENIVNQEYIYDLYNKDKQKICTKDLITCGLYGGTLSNFINLVYNELVFYAAFGEYYKYALGMNNNFKNTDGTSLDIKTRKQNERSAIITKNLIYSKEAIKITIKMLKEMEMTYPLHIGFLLYTESIHTFSNQFTKTLTPIYTLYDLFKNVQNPQ